MLQSSGSGKLFAHLSGPSYYNISNRYNNNDKSIPRSNMLKTIDQSNNRNRAVMMARKTGKPLRYYRPCSHV